jgi:hypothetical protein
MTPTTARIHVVSEGVLASYIHDISTRTVRRRPPIAHGAESRRPNIRRRTSTQELLSYTAK